MLHVHTRLTPLQGPDSPSFCVMFLEDLREMEARLRTEKLAAMGRMSAAVAHEIRNPLAAIVQANALLDEELADPTQRQLSELVRQNAHRLSRIVEEILDIARVQQQGTVMLAALDLDENVAGICADWAQHARAADRLRLAPGAAGLRVQFEPDHMRRVQAVKSTFTVEDIYARAKETLEGCIKHGATRIRTEEQGERAV